MSQRAKHLPNHPARRRAYGELDSKNGEAVMELLRELHQSGATICIVAHDARYASHAERTIRLFDGRVVEEPVPAH